MENLDLLKNKPIEIPIGNETITFEEMTAGKAFRVVEKYQRALSMLANQTGDVLSKTRLMKVYQSKILDVCIDIIHPAFSLRNLFKRDLSARINKKWIYNHMTTKQMERFIKIVLDPILPDDSKKKIEEVEKAIGL